ncbi:hypothetical protein SLA2020_043530 [Shorea laevis]
MGTCRQNKISTDIAAESSSLDYLSFADLVCKFSPADVFSNSEIPPQAVLTQAIGKLRYKNSPLACHISSNRSTGNQNDYIKASAKAHKCHVVKSTVKANTTLNKMLSLQ